MTGHTEKQPAAYSQAVGKPTKGQRVKRTCARWWWLFLIVLASVVLLIVLPLIYVAYPKQAREQIQKAKIEVLAMTIDNPTPNSVDMAFQQKFTSDSKYHSTLLPFNGSFYLLDNATNPTFASIRTPEIKAGNGVISEVPKQQVNITNLYEFTRYVLQSLAANEFAIALRGTGDLKQGILPTTSVDYDTNITFTGFGGLKGFAISEFHVLNQTEADGTNAIGKASIPNPTVMTVDMGTVTLQLSVGGNSIGNATIPSLVLKPGDNLVDLRAVIYQLVVVGIVLKQQDPILSVDIKGYQSIHNGQILPYYTTVLGLLTLNRPLNVTAALEGSGVGGYKMRRALQSVQSSPRSS